jgi:hypothetical protein
MPPRQPRRAPRAIVVRPGRMGASHMEVRMDIDIETVLWLAIAGVVVVGGILGAAALWSFVKPK